MKPMQGEEYARALRRLGFSNRGFCLDVIGVDDSTGRRWISGDLEIPGSVAGMLRLAIALELDAGEIRKILKIG